MSFELSFLGCSGGPVETSNCAILVKPAQIPYSDILTLPDAPFFMIDGGAGLLLLAELIADEEKQPKLLLLYEDSLLVEKYMNVKRTFPFRTLKGPAIALLAAVLAKVAGALITHPHADHVLAIVLNLPGMVGKRASLPLYGSQFTMDTLQNHIFNGHVWPDMVLLGVLELNSLSSKVPTDICNNAFSVIRFDLSHGIIHDTKETYESLAYLVTCSQSHSKILAFGDFEADSVLGLHKNLLIWKHVAPFVIDGSLKCIILECSMHSVAPDAQLYGHLTPRHLIEELEILNEILKTMKIDPLQDLHIVVTHVKENIEGQDPRRRIQKELNELNDASGLGLRITMALSGVSMVV